MLGLGLCGKQETWEAEGQRDEWWKGGGADQEAKVTAQGDTAILKASREKRGP